MSAEPWPHPSVVAEEPETDEDERTAALKGLWAPTPPELIAQLPKGGKMLDYLGHADTCRVFAAVDPYWEWKPSPELALSFGHYEVVGNDEHGNPLRVGTPVVRNQDGYAIKLYITLTVLGVTRPGVGTVATGKTDPEKELIGDAIRNAAQRFGVGADLWSKAGGALDENADKPEPRRGGSSWFERNGWVDKAEHDEWAKSRQAALAREREDNPEDAPKVEAWLKEHGLDWKWDKAVKKTLADELDAFMLPSPPTEEPLRIGLTCSNCQTLINPDGSCECPF